MAETGLVTERTGCTAHHERDGEQSGPTPGTAPGLYLAAGQLFMLKVSKQPKWYALACSRSFTVTLICLPGEK